jgi:hypothetical protein
VSALFLWHVLVNAPTKIAVYSFLLDCIENLWMNAN